MENKSKDGLVKALSNTIICLKVCVHYAIDKQKTRYGDRTGSQKYNENIV